MYFKANILICFTVPTVLITPGYFAIDVYKSSDSPTETKGYWKLNEFGETKQFKLYAFIILILQTVIPLISLTVMNIIALVRFRKIKTDISSLNTPDINDERIQETINRYTKLIIILTFICVIARTFDATLSLYNRVRLFLGIVLSDDLEALSRLMRLVAYLLIFTEHALDGVLYYIFDKNMRAFLKGDRTDN